ncbi:MAG: hypothetical protein ABI837_18470 [Acidobacteriota bacterium]
MADAALVDALVAKLSVPVGPHVAKMLIRSFTKKAGTGDSLTAAQIPAFIEEIRPMVMVLLGKAATEVIAADLIALAARYEHP